MKYLLILKIKNKKNPVWEKLFKILKKNYSKTLKNNKINKNPCTKIIL